VGAALVGCDVRDYLVAFLAGAFLVVRFAVLFFAAVRLAPTFFAVDLLAVFLAATFFVAVFLAVLRLAATFLAVFFAGLRLVVFLAVVFLVALLAVLLLAGLAFLVTVFLVVAFFAAAVLLAGALFLAAVVFLAGTASPPCSGSPAPCRSIDESSMADNGLTLSQFALEATARLVATIDSTHQYTMLGHQHVRCQREQHYLARKAKGRVSFRRCGRVNDATTHANLSTNCWPPLRTSTRDVRQLRGQRGLEGLH
jgi:signal transduction histidine kinase